MIHPYSRRRRARIFMSVDGSWVLVRTIRKQMCTTGKFVSDHVQNYHHRIRLFTLNAIFLHYRSLSGEGNFNWRFVFPFKYMRYEDRVVFSQKKAFDLEPAEVKVPAELTLQIWDNELIRNDKFLGMRIRN